MIRTIEITKTKESKNQDDPLRPTIIPWKDARMIRVHSIRASVKEIIQASESQDVVHINLIGDPSSGKTTLGKTLSHLIHKMSKIPFSVRFFEKEDLLNFEETLKSLSPANYVLNFDDISFLGASATKKQIEIVKQATTEIRHLEGGQDVKIITIRDFHYTLGVDKYLRQNDFTYFTSVGSSEDDNMEKIVGSKYMNKVINFKKMRTKIKIAPEEQKKFTYRLGNKGTFTYGYRKPFIPLLYWNNDTLRDVVSPTREWIDEICSTCTEFGTDEKFESEIDVKQFIDESGVKFGESTFKAAVKLKLYVNGINVNDPRLVSAGRYLDRALARKNISLEEIATHYGFTPTNTKLRKKLPDYFDEKEEKPVDNSINSNILEQDNKEQKKE